MKICFLGQGKEICEIEKKLRNQNELVVGFVTYPKEEHLSDNLEHECEKENNLYTSIFDYTKANKIPIFESKNLNLHKTIEWIKNKKPDLLISWRNRSILKDEFLLSFDKKIINIHIGDLPKYRGSSAMSWMILNNEIETAVVYHFIEKGIDTGAIIARYPFTIEEDSYPIDMYKKASEKIINTCPEVVNMFKKKTIITKKQNDLNATYFPRLKTVIDGKIDFNLSASEVKKIVRAFGWPYAGAFGIFRKKKVHIARVKILPMENKYHNYTNGLVISNNSIKGSVTIITGGEILEILTVREGNKEIPAIKLLKPGTVAQ